ncbi:hypothetical protein SAMN04490185_0641 [Pseudomonas frederiksbergensis]|uniref:Bulb-type lectin domain-containing protein n=1 Tax=Pseudomonas frederiksbergensis TaxID=104087 RepID=A0A1H4NYK6_9PSED|nr:MULTISPECIES: hypothetical protein [Pseudomonas]PMU07275.1 hypothetical protein C1Y11_28250 [Pseudomonas sp. FW305-20]PMU13481.1 hypothetical protein C1Y10_27980 [Pseudomonas sp. FW305-122]PMU34180.1 hypothetical protein C1Y12_28060 [Pseudomonas sp. FW305-47B]PMX56510.1 hypothetical protein C1Y13_27895 [Pseudomonas sp. FW305-33]PMX62930.1 hypothetical protein C1X12_23220 [Pseudomonas sp. FW305-60]
MAITYTPFQASGSPVLPPNQMMSPGQYLISLNGRFRLLLQADGNLIITDNGAVVWIADGSQTYSRTLHPKKMREPLMFVISNNGFLYDPSRRRLWIAESTHSSDKSLWYNTCMVIQDDGNLVIYDQRTGDLRWARSGFVPGRIPKAKERFTRVLEDGTEIKTWKFSLGPL